MLFIDFLLNLLIDLVEIMTTIVNKMIIHIDTVLIIVLNCEGLSSPSKKVFLIISLCNAIFSGIEKSMLDKKIIKHWKKWSLYKFKLLDPAALNSASFCNWKKLK